MPIGGDAHVAVWADGSAVAVSAPDGPPRVEGDRIVTVTGAELSPTGAPLGALPSISSLWFAVVASMPEVELVVP